METPLPFCDDANEQDIEIERLKHRNSTSRPDMHWWQMVTP